MQVTAPATAHSLSVSVCGQQALVPFLPQPGENTFKDDSSTSTAGAAGTAQSLTGLATSSGGSDQPVRLQPEGDTKLPNMVWLQLPYFTQWVCPIDLITQV